MFNQSESHPRRQLIPSTGTAPTHARLLAWLDTVVDLCRPDAIHYCDGSSEEAAALAAGLVDAGTLVRLNDALQPNSLYARTDPDDVAASRTRPSSAPTTSATPAPPTTGWIRRR
ncbi:hypothetical protein [Tessaracoccus coleopterorum]|uniref:hypothetical protein n=1 Tax=Tessaracoccus coleopterorum TaxID=2714950 RepID=UPI001E464D71|nr:hypothetical protein [Tessaracoccus coleopterorum]